MIVTPIADMVDAMVADEMPAKAIALAVRALETSVAALPVTLPATLPGSLPQTRSRKAINQARYRNNLKTKQGAGVAMAAASSPATEVVTQPVTSGNAVTGVPLSVLSSLTESQGIQKEEKKEEILNTEPRAKSKRGTRLADDWQPTDADMKFAAGRRLRLVEIEIEATKFRNYWTNRTDKQAAKLDWSKAWQNWILNVRQGANNGPGRARTVQDAAADLLDEVRNLNELPARIRGGTGEPDVRLLPPR